MTVSTTLINPKKNELKSHVNKYCIIVMLPY